jgi:hypothetical protein
MNLLQHDCTHCSRRGGEKADDASAASPAAHAQGGGDLAADRSEAAAACRHKTLSSPCFG